MLPSNFLSQPPMSMVDPDPSQDRGQRSPLTTSGNPREDQQLVSGAVQHQPSCDMLTPEKALESLKISGIKQEDVDAMLARDLYHMSIDERQKTYEEVHGVCETLCETPELIQKCLLEFEEAILRIENKPAYWLAWQQKPQYVSSAKFRIMFLRANDFNAQKAAQQCVDFLQAKLDLFGPQTLTRSVRYSDMGPDDIACMKTGAFQLIPARDSSGRAIVTDFHLVTPERCYKQPENFLRTVAFLYLAVAEDEETQKRGVVVILYFLGKFNGHFNRKLNQKVMELDKWSPLKVKAIHICSDNPVIKAWRPIGLYLMEKKLRVRVRVHDGTPTEVRYSLMTFGIPVDALPVTYKGDIKTGNIFKWIQRRRAMEERARSVGKNDHGLGDIIELPALSDVILRRGRIFHNHPGNQRMRELVDAHQDDYGNAEYKKKWQIAAKIVDKIRSSGGRFLECSKDGWWTEVDTKEAIQRVGKAIRSKRASSDAVQQLQQPASKPSSSLSVEHRGKRQRSEGSDSEPESSGCFAAFATR